MFLRSAKAATENPACDFWLLTKCLKHVRALERGYSLNHAIQQRDRIPKRQCCLVCRPLGASIQDTWVVFLILPLTCCVTINSPLWSSVFPFPSFVCLVCLALSRGTVSYEMYVQHPLPTEASRLYCSINNKGSCFQ